MSINKKKMNRLKLRENRNNKKRKKRIKKSLPI